MCGQKKSAAFRCDECNEVIAVKRELRKNERLGSTAEQRFASKMHGLEYGKNRSRGRS